MGGMGGMGGMGPKYAVLLYNTISNTISLFDSHMAIMCSNPTLKIIIISARA